VVGSSIAVATANNLIRSATCVIERDKDGAPATRASNCRNCSPVSDPVVDAVWAVAPSSEDDLFCAVVAISAKLANVNDDQL